MLCLECDGARFYTGASAGAAAAALLDAVVYRLAACSRGGLVMHAAAVARSGRAMLLPGQTGTGKTTLTAWLLAQGFRYQSDELAFIAELTVSELVTNAYRYGGAPVILRLIRDRVLICEVSDSSSTSPHLRRARMTDEGRPSTGQDIQKGRRTEIDFLNGLVAEKGDEAGIPTPTHKALVQVVKEVERKEVAPSPALVDRVWELSGARPVAIAQPAR